MKTLIDHCFRAAYKLIYPLGIAFIRLTGYKINGVFVYIWHDGCLLIVKNSYKKVYSLPGGLLKKGEDPIQGGIREAYEEVGITLDPAALTLFSEQRDDLGGIAYMIRVQMTEQPAIHIDQREIIWADFVPSEKVTDYPFHPAALSGLAHPANPPVELPTT